jgi:ABC-2 type transport system permease protein
MRLALLYARVETRQLLRFPAYWIPTLGFSAIALLLFGRHLERGEPERLLAGFAATALLTVAFFPFGVGIAAGRATPWESYLRTLPVTPGERLAGRVLSALAFGAATTAIVALVATTVYGAAPPAWRFAALVVALLLGSMPFALLGIALGYWLSPRAALPVANLLFLPLAIAGSLWARPDDGVPHEADVASQLLPTRSWIEVLDSIATGDDPLPLHHVVALAAWGAAFLALAGWGYRRDEGERFR